MSPNSSDKPPAAAPAPVEAPAEKPRRTYRWWLLVVLPVWVFAAFMLAQLLLVGTILGLKALGVAFDFVNASVLDTAVAALTYLLSLLIALGIPWLLKKRVTTLADLGLTRLATWADIGLAPAGFLVYIIASGGLVYLAGQIFSGFDTAQTQNVGFNNISYNYEYMLAFATLVIIAPFAEELLFRGYLYGKLRKAIPLWLAMIVTSALFGAIHGQWNVGVDVFVLSMVACSLREVTGSIWAGVLLHILKNGLAFYIIFVNTSFLVQ